MQPTFKQVPDAFRRIKFETTTESGEFNNKHTTQSATLLNASNLHAKLAGLDSGNVATRTTANDDQVQLFSCVPNSKTKIMRQ